MHQVRAFQYITGAGPRGVGGRSLHTPGPRAAAPPGDRLYLGAELRAGQGVWAGQ